MRFVPVPQRVGRSLPQIQPQMPQIQPQMPQIQPQTASRFGERCAPQNFAVRDGRPV
jgi:hypothetical protein